MLLTDKPFSSLQAVVPPQAEDLLARGFERLGRLPYKAGLSLQRAQEGWFSLAGSELHVVFPEGPCEEPLQLRKLQELCAWLPSPGPHALRATLAQHACPLRASPALGCLSVNLCISGWIPLGVCAQRAAEGSRLGS